MRRDPTMPGKYITVIGKTAFVELTRGKTAILDAGDVPLIDSRLWKAQPKGELWYAENSDLGGMHRVILGEEAEGMVVDHIDGDGLNNRRSNLRACLTRDNIRNSRKRTVSGVRPTSEFKGVTRHSGGRWRAQIMRDGIKVNLGAYASEEMAARVYDMAAREYFGEYARPNFEEPSPAEASMFARLRAHIVRTMMVFPLSLSMLSPLVSSGRPAEVRTRYLYRVNVAPANDLRTRSLIPNNLGPKTACAHRAHMRMPLPNRAHSVRTRRGAE